MSLNESRIEKKVQGIVATMAIEGMNLTEEEIHNVRSILKGEKDGKQLISEVKRTYGVS